jgi:hypothetical protein
MRSLSSVSFSSSNPSKKIPPTSQFIILKLLSFFMRGKPEVKTVQKQFGLIDSLSHNFYNFPFNPRGLSRGLVA